MKNRIKKFYKDHEEAVDVMIGALIGTVIFAGYAIRKLEYDNAVIAHREIESPSMGLRFFEVYQRNGKMTTFERDIPVQP